MFLDLDTTNYINPRDPEVLELHRKMMSDDRIMARALFPEIFRVKFNSLHAEIFGLLRKQGRKKLILAPRGIGKTSIVRFVCKKAILYGEKNFIVYVGNSSTLAEMQTENIKRSLVGNPVIRKLFGDIRNKISNVEDFDDMDEQFSKKASVLFGRTLLLPRGMGQQIRGLNWHDQRPDLVIFDDPEKMDELRNELNRENNLNWLFSDALQAGDNHEKNTDFVYIDTLKHYDAMPMHLIETGDWDHIRLSICSPAPEYKSLAPEFMSDEEIKKMVLAFNKVGKLDVFHREYMNEPIAPGTASFKYEYFKHYEESTLTRDELNSMVSMVLVDPAKSVTPKSDDSAIVGVGIDTQRRRIYIRDVVAGKFYPDELYEEAINMALRLRCEGIAIEVTSLNEFVLYPFKNTLEQKGIHNLSIVELKARKKKEDRITSLIPLYRQGLVYHNATCCQQLEDQLLAFPASQRDDIMDAEAYLVELFEIGGQYALPEMPVLPMEPKQLRKTQQQMDQDIIDAEFSQIEYDKPVIMEEWV